MSKTAEIRTQSALVGWDVAKSKKHDCSMVETPQAWLFIKIKGKYYPYQVA